MRKRLKSLPGARVIDVPYKQNRMIMFDSALFHETQAFKFSEKRYDEKRINFTLLYGVRTDDPDGARNKFL